MMLGIRDLLPFLFLIYLFSDSVLRKKPNYIAILTYGFFLGFLRRLLPNDSIFMQNKFYLDPLLLVIPISLLLCLSVSKIGQLDSKILNYSLKLLILLSTIQIFNPRQGSVLVGLVGWLAYVVPILFVYLGTTVDDNALNRILEALKLLGLIVCAYGLAQVVFGYNFWDRRWYQIVTRNGDYTVLAYGINRPFGTFSSVGEYAQVIGLATVAVVFQYLNSVISFRRFFSYVVFFLMSSALTASRGSLIFTFMIALAPALFASTKKLKATLLIPKLLPYAVGTAWAVPLIVDLIPSDSLGNAKLLVDRQAAGLAGNHSEVTSASVHITQTLDAFRESFSSIFGYGVGAISGAQRLNGLTRLNFESDIGNSSYAFGIFGFIIMLLVFYSLYSALIKCNSKLSILGFLILLASINNWFNPGHYSTVWLVWLLMGKVFSARREIEIEPIKNH
ncbi:MAG: hypothetical protein RLZZ44_1320 [Bacteroidota bacterium]